MDNFLRITRNSNNPMGLTKVFENFGTNIRWILKHLYTLQIAQKIIRNKILDPNSWKFFLKIL